MRATVFFDGCLGSGCTCGAPALAGKVKNVCMSMWLLASAAVDDWMRYIDGTEPPFGLLRLWSGEYSETEGGAQDDGLEEDKYDQEIASVEFCHLDHQSFRAHSEVRDLCLPMYNFLRRYIIQAFSAKRRCKQSGRHSTGG